MGNPMEVFNVGYRYNLCSGMPSLRTYSLSKYIRRTYSQTLPVYFSSLGDQDAVVVEWLVCLSLVLEFGVRVSRKW